MKIKAATIDEAKSQKKARKSTEEEIDYKSLPGVVVLKNDAEFYNWQVFGTKTEPKRK